MMKLAFKDESVRVTAVRLGSDAFAAIDAHPPDIIFTENARKVVAFLKSRPNLPRIPVVLLKGASMRRPLVPMKKPRTRC